MMRVVDLKFLFNNVIENNYLFVVYTLDDNGTLTIEDNMRVNFIWSPDMEHMTCIMSENNGRDWQLYAKYYAPDTTTSGHQMAPEELLDSSKYRFISSWLGIPIANVGYLLNFSESILYPDRVKKDEPIIH